VAKSGNLSKKQFAFGNRGSLDRKVLSLFFVVSGVCIFYSVKVDCFSRHVTSLRKVYIYVRVCILV